MSWLWQFPAGGSPNFTFTTRNPEFGEVHRLMRRQASARTDGGVVFVEDLGVDEEVIEATFMNLCTPERANLEKIFSEPFANRQENPITIQITNDPVIGGQFMQALTTGMVIDRVPLTTGQGFTTGDRVVADDPTLPIVFLDQPDLVFEQIRHQQYSLTLRLRLSIGPLPEIL